MNNYNCKIVADSLNTFGNRITTFKLTYPRIVHAELMTHRMFSRNAASSRAVPVKKMIESVKNNMFTPLTIQKAHKGMQGSEYFEGEELKQAKQLWIESAELTLQQADKMEKFGITKQLINRILEPYQYYQVIVTATEFENFFKLRCPQYEDISGNLYRSKKDFIKLRPEAKHDSLFYWLSKNKSQADIHIQAIAELMWDAMNESTPRQLKAGDYHIPFGNNIDLDRIMESYPEGTIKALNMTLPEVKKAIAIARCARISYLNFEGKDDYQADIKLYNILKENGHASPFEHVAKAMNEEEYTSNYMKIEGNNIKLLDNGIVDYSEASGWCRNFKGFIQERHILGL